MKSDFATSLLETQKIHGHLCAGQVLGIRMSLLGLREIGIREPKGEDRKNLIVFVEIDRCATDAIQSTTGCSFGKRTMKFFDYGKMAATFLNLKTGKAVRIAAKEEARQKAKGYFPEIGDKDLAQREAYKVMPDDELFLVQDVVVTIPDHDRPGRPLSHVICDVCGEGINDRREVRLNGQVLCRPCAEGSYYRMGIGFFIQPDIVKQRIRVGDLGKQGPSVD
ncbi:MAG: FmdE family protein [Thermodesulfobacteriota bacterium]